MKSSSIISVLKRTIDNIQDIELRDLRENLDFVFGDMSSFKRMTIEEKASYVRDLKTLQEYLDSLRKKYKDYVEQGRNTRDQIKESIKVCKTRLKRKIYANHISLTTREYIQPKDMIDIYNHLDLLGKNLHMVDDFIQEDIQKSIEYGDFSIRASKVIECYENYCN